MDGNIIKDIGFSIKPKTKFDEALIPDLIYTGFANIKGSYLKGITQFYPKENLTFVENSLNTKFKALVSIYAKELKEIRKNYKLKKKIN